MYKIVKTIDTYADPQTTVCPIGVRTNQKKRFADICILATGVSSAKVYINSSILIEAIRNTPFIMDQLVPPEEIRAEVVLNITIPEAEEVEDAFKDVDASLKDRINTSKKKKLKEIPPEKVEVPVTKEEWEG